MDLIHEDVVISGIGGYFPKSVNIEELQHHLLNNENLLETRWKHGERGVCNIVGKVSTEFFDNSYFGIHRQQCTFMDPMQRLILERTFEALIDAGVNPTEVKGRRIGVYMGSAIGENDNLFLESIVSGFGVTGHSRAMMPNRVSYWLNLKGPSVAYDSNWIGGIEVIRLAYNAIKSGQCESAIVGTANLCLNSEFQWLYTDMGLLSPDGSTRAFDAQANGYARSDGVVVLYLQKASEAKRYYASVVNVATRFNGNREGNLLNIDVPSMTNFMNDFYQKLPVTPQEVEFVEAYGCACKETDEKEIAALEQVYCKNRKNPLLVGSIKTNTGHSEASAALFAVAKVLIAMETETIPANLQFETPNPNITAFKNNTIEVVTQNKPWKAEYAAVNAIGIDSYYGHLLLKSNPKKKKLIKDDLPRLVLASTRTEEGIKSILETVKTKEGDSEYYQLLQDLFAKPILGHLYRGYTLVGSAEPKQETEYHQGNKRQIWFVYSGMGSQWNGMVSDLMKLPIFADAIHKCHNILKSKGVDLMDIISSDDKTIYDNILHSFVGIAAIQIALTDVLKAIGIVPDGIIGHSVGELGCAYADNCMTAEQMMLSAYSRGKASLEASLIPGMMAAIGVGYNQIKTKLPPTIEVACHNGPDSATLSGPKDDMKKFVEELQAQGTFARLVNVSNIAYHSRYIKPAAPLLLKYLKEVLPEPVKRSSKWVTTSNTEDNWNTDLALHSSADYHTNNLLSSVLFEEGLKHIPKDSILIEIAPHGLLQAILKRSLKSGCTNIALTQRGSKSGTEFLLQAFGKMYLAGMDLTVSNVYPKLEYPVAKGTPTLANLSHWNHTESWRTGLEDKLHSLYGVRDTLVTLNSEEFRECVGHQLDDKIVLPTSHYLNIVYQIISSISSGHKEIIFENLYFKNNLVIPKIGSVPLHAMVQKGSGDFEILSNKDIIMMGRMTFPQPNEKFTTEPAEVPVGEDNTYLNGSDVYNELQHRGHQYSEPFKSIKNIILAEEGSVGTIQADSRWTMILEAMIQQRLLEAGERNQDIQVPKTIQRITIDQNLLPEEKSDIKVTYDYSTKILSTPGIQITNICTTPLEKDPMTVFYDSIEYVQLNNANYPKIEYGISAAVQLTIANSYNEDLSNIAVSVIESNNNLLEQTKTALAENPLLNPNIVLVKDCKQVVIQQSLPHLLILNDTINDEIVKLVAVSHVFALVKTSKSLLNHSNIVQVAEFGVDNVSYTVVRSINNSQASIIYVNSTTVSIKDLKSVSLPWVKELHSHQNDKNRVYLVVPAIPTEGFENFAEEVGKIISPQSLRLVYDLEKKSEKLKPNDLILKQDLALTIRKDGTSYAYLPIPVKLKEDVSVKNNPDQAFKNRNIKYIGINLDDETLNPASRKKIELGNVDYSGTIGGKNIMGLAVFDKDNSKLVEDNILNWEVPPTWTTEDAVTIPHAYVSAYYSLYIKAKLKPGDTVLIHGGCTAIGLAAISVASIEGCTIFTTVATDWQKAYLKKHFNFLKDRHILSSENSTFEPLFMIATGGRGADIIINTLSGSLLQCSLSCIADYGRFIHIGKYDLEENNSIGMYCFLKNTSFFAVDLGNVLYQSKEVKQEIKKLVEEGIEKLCVRPLVRKVENHYDFNAILEALRKSNNVGKIIVKVDENLPINKLNVKRPNQFICNAKSSYLVQGGSVEQWADITEWLVLRGARKIVISTDSKPQQNHINRRLSLLQTYFGAEIIMISNKPATKEGAAELLSEVYLLGPIHIVYLLPNSSKSNDLKYIQYIENALRTVAPKAFLVNFINHASGISQTRTDAGFNNYNIQWSKELQFPDAVKCLDDVMNLTVRNILIKNDKVSDTKEESAQGLYKKLVQIIPQSIEDICRETDLSPKTPELVQMITEGPMEIRELAPLFIIPGITGQRELREMAQSLLYPTFCALLPSVPMGIQELAQAYVERFREIWPKGPYNIVGLSWGGILAIEIARILDKLNVSLHLYLIDGAPQTLQSVIKQLGEESVTRDVGLLSRIFNINDAKILKEIGEAKTWDDRVNIAAATVPEPTHDSALLNQGLLLLKHRLEDVLHYKPDDRLVSGVAHLIRPGDCSKYDNCGLTSYCKQTPNVVLINGDHLSIINEGTAEYINQTFQLI